MSVDELKATIIADAAGDQLWIYGSDDGFTSIGTVMSAIQDDGDSPGFAATFDAAGLALVIAELSRRLYGMLAAELPLKSDEPAPELYKCAGPSCPGLPWRASERAHPESCVDAPERPIAEMTRAEIRAELGFRGDVLDDLERNIGGLSSPATSRQAELVAALRERAQKAAAT